MQDNDDPNRHLPDSNGREGSELRPQENETDKSLTSTPKHNERTTRMRTQRKKKAQKQTKEENTETTTARGDSSLEIEILGANTVKTIKPERPGSRAKRLNQVIQGVLEGKSQVEVAAELGIVPATITEIFHYLTSIKEELLEIKKLRRHRGDIIDAAYYRVLKSGLEPKKLKKASTFACVSAADMLYKQSRLENNQSTSNVATSFITIHTDDDVK